MTIVSGQQSVCATCSFLINKLHPDSAVGVVLLILIINDKTNYNTNTARMFTFLFETHYNVMQHDLRKWILTNLLKSRILKSTNEEGNHFHN